MGSHPAHATCMPAANTASQSDPLTHSHVRRRNLTWHQPSRSGLPFPCGQGMFLENQGRVLAPLERPCGTVCPAPANPPGSHPPFSRRRVPLRAEPLASRQYVGTARQGCGTLVWSLLPRPPNPPTLPKIWFINRALTWKWTNGRLHGRPSPVPFTQSALCGCWSDSLRCVTRCVRVVCVCVWCEAELQALAVLPGGGKEERRGVPRERTK